MKAKDTSYLIEITRQAPTELAKQEVLSFIKTIPTLPPPSSNWFQNFNLNSIIMTTTAIALVTSAVIYFTSPTEQKDIEPIDPGTAKTPVLVADSLAQPSTNLITNLTTIQFEGREEVISIETTSEISAIAPIIEPKSTDQVVTSAEALDKSKTAGDPKPVIWPDAETTDLEVDNRVSLNEGQLKSLRKSLERQVKEDDLNRGKSKFLVVKFSEDSLTVNHRALTEAQKVNYQDLMESFWIKPGSDRYIILDKSFIMVGDFIKEGFSGSALGKAVDVTIKRRPATIKQTSDGSVESKKVTLNQINIRLLDEPKRVGGYFFQAAITSDTKPNLSPSELRTLKRQLLRLLKEDNIDQSGIANFSTLWYTAQSLKLNDKDLKGEMYSRYASVIRSFDINPGPNRRVVINNDFIQVGDYTDKGFDGQALGKHMEIYFIDKGDNKKDLFSKGTESKSSLMGDKDDDTILKTMGTFKHSEVNLSEVDRILEDQGNTPPKDGNRFYDSGKEAISIYTKRTENTFVELNGTQLKSLKKDLYRELQRDRLIDNRKEDVRFLFVPEGILVNDAKLTEQQVFSYHSFLEKYGIEPAAMRKILMCTDFIVVGDFVKGNFHGSLKGSLNSQDIKKSVFKQDFEDFPVFGFDKAMKDK